MRIESDGTPEHTRILTDAGEDIGRCVRSVRWSLDGGSVATATVELLIVKAPRLDGEVVWVGLEDVPAEALEAELTRRREDEAAA
jgi:hypothetical protein